MDRISSLPDNVLLHILSFLPMNYVVATSLLARRWRNLWTSVPNLDFDANKFNDRTQIAKAVSMCLMRYEGLKVHKFRVSLPILSVDRCFIDTWISFAKKHNVEELDLDFPDGFYEVPQHLSNCDTLRVLTLSWCYVTHPFRFLSLKKLHLLNGLLLDLDTSGIPLLEDLVISGYNYNGRLSIRAPNPKLRNLSIYYLDEAFGFGEIAIYAPHLLSFEIVGGLGGRYDIKDFSSITNVNLNLNDMLVQGADDDFVAGCLRELLKNVRHANNLKLSRWCIQVLSMVDAQNLEIPVLNATCLELETNLNKWELPGITCVLKNSPRLQILVINFSRRDTRVGIWHLNEDVFENIDPWEILELVLSLSRLQLKTVQLNNLLLTARGARVGNIDLNECLEYAGNLIKLLRLLLMCCNKLDKVIIEETPLLRESPVKSELLQHLSKELRVRAMASANVEICFA